MSEARQMLMLEQEQFLSVRSFACDYGTGARINVHRHRWHQLLYGISGAMSVHAAHQTWMIPPGKAALLSAGCDHSIHMWGLVAMRSLAFPLGTAGLALTESGCRVLTITPLLRELVLRVVAVGALDCRIPRQQSLLAVLLEEIRTAPETALTLPLPSDRRALAIARHVLAECSSNESLNELGIRFGVGRRTAERLFQKETGMSFGFWRQKARMLDSMRLLAEGRSVTETALDEGYSSVSAFVAAFKQTFGCTPGRLAE